MTDRDDREDDPQLQSLRAVWRSMPDEEPPQRGLAELMAAARVKAEQMAKPSLWQRIIAVLRRPPVMALATVMVILGGVLLIGPRKGDVEVAQPALHAAQDPAPAEAVVAPGSAAETDDRARDPAEPASVLAAEVPALVAEDKPAAEPKTPPRRAPARRTAKPASTSTTANAELARRNAEAAGVPASAPATPPTIDHEAAAFADEPARAAAAADSPSAGASTPARPPVHPDIARAKAAAARGDCQTARELMKRVANESAAQHRQALASDAALEKCVAP